MENKKDKTNILCIILLIVQYLLLGLAYMYFMCSCGYSLINKVPIIIFLIIQFIIFLYLIKKHSPYKIKFIFISIILLIIVAIFTRNDMDEIHSRVFGTDSINNEIIDPISIRSLDLSK